MASVFRGSGTPALVDPLANTWQWADDNEDRLISGHPAHAEHGRSPRV